MDVNSVNGEGEEIQIIILVGCVWRQQYQEPAVGPLVVVIFPNPLISPQGYKLVVR